jgi:hypothetical protein
MKVRMLALGLGSPDGIQVITYKAGEKYDMPTPLANMFIGMGKAIEDKDMGGPPEVKAWAPSPEPGGPFPPPQKEKKRKRQKKESVYKFLGGKHGELQ